jgi:septal ring factor EnvC (AmiA/AmiB activator)
VLFVLCSASYAEKNTSDDYETTIQSRNRELESIKDELSRGRQKLKQLRNQEGSYLAQMSQVQKNIRISQDYLNKLSIRIDAVSATVSILEDSVKSETHKLGQRQFEMKKRLRAIYKSGQLALPQVVMSSRSSSDMLHRIRYFEGLHLYDRNLLHQIDSVRVGVQKKKTVLQRQYDQLSLLKQDKEQEHLDLVEDQQAYRKLLAGVRTQKTAFAAAVKQLEASQRAIKNIIAVLEAKRKKEAAAAAAAAAAPSVPGRKRPLLPPLAESGFGKLRGSLPWPVIGVVVSGFGRVVNSVYKTVVMNTGIDIGANKGQHVCCVTEGKVAYTGSMRGFGSFVIVDHGGYYTTYAHLDNVAVKDGDNVKRGSQLGTVGGGSDFDSPRLHFEIRKGTEALNPLDWLGR